MLKEVVFIEISKTKCTENGLVHSYMTADSGGLKVMDKILIYRQGILSCTAVCSDFEFEKAAMLQPHYTGLHVITTLH